MIIREFKNGNLNIKLESDEMEDVKGGHVALTEVLQYGLDTVDTYFLELGFYGNDETLYTFENIRLGVQYNYLYCRDSQRLMSGKTIKLYASK